MLVIPALGRQMQVDFWEFKVSLVYKDREGCTVGSYLKKQTKE